ncbi:MAG: nicotinamide riboside transporter PnuC [Pseudomonadota bacterium]
MNLTPNEVIEWVIVAAAVAYLVLAIRQSIWCWPLAFLSTALSIYLFSEVSLYMESALNVFYLVMAVLGYWQWRARDVATAQHDGPPVGTLHWSFHLGALIVIALLVWLSSAVLSHYTDQVMPVVDSLTSWTAVWATWLQVRKVLENWFYWLAIDLVSIWLYLERGLEGYALLFGVYVVMIPFGYVAWRRSMRAATGAAT